MLNIPAIRQQFPILHQQVNGNPLIYLDNAATSQKPQRVIDALMGYYTGYNSNVHRGAHYLAEKATIAFEKTRETARRFLNARAQEEIIYTKGTTEAINLVAYSYARHHLNKGDEIWVSALEHHSNIVPWQLMCEEKGAVLRVIPINDKGELELGLFEKQLTEKAKLVSVAHVSNVLGTVNDIRQVAKLAHGVGAVLFVDGAQGAPHFHLDVQAMDCDFYAFSGHKVYGPTGTGILYGKKKILDAMPPFFGGGEMIKEVTFEKTTFNTLPHKFEAGTPNIADMVALDEALNFVDSVGKDAMAKHEHHLLEVGTSLLSEIGGVRLVGTAAQKASVISFVVEGAHHYDVGMMLDAKGVAVRTGHHCAQPLMKRLGIEGTVRASFAVYNTEEEIATLAKKVKEVMKVLA